MIENLFMRYKYIASLVKLIFIKKRLHIKKKNFKFVQNTYENIALIQTSIYDSNFIYLIVLFY